MVVLACFAAAACAPDVGVEGGAPEPSEQLVSASSLAPSAGDERSDSGKYEPYVSAEEVDADLTAIYNYVSQGSGGWAVYDEVYFACMAEAGFDVPADVRPERGDPAIEEPVTAAIPFESADIADVAERGYLAGQAREEPQNDGQSEDIIANDPLSQWIAGLSPAEQAQYYIADMGSPNDDEIVVQTDGGEFRVPTGGCHASATEARVGVELTDFAALVAGFNDVNRAVVSATESDPEYQQAVERWFACVEEQGYEPVDPNTLSGPVAIAIADRACRDAVQLSDARTTARVKAANEQRDRIGELVAATAP